MICFAAVHLLRQERKLLRRFYDVRVGAVSVTAFKALGGCSVPRCGADLPSPGFMTNSAAISAIIARPAVSSRILFAVMRLPPVNCSSVSVRIFTAKPILCKTAIIIA